MASSRKLPTSYNESTFGDATRDYTSLNTWEAATDNNLVTATNGEVLTCYDDSAPYNQTPYTWSGATVNSSYFRVVRAADGHEGTDDSGVRLYSTSTAANASVVDVTEQYFQFHDISTYFSVNSTNLRYGFSANGNYQRYVGCLFKGRGGTNNLRGFNATLKTGVGFINCAAWDCGSGANSTGFRFFIPTSCFVYNCTAHDNKYGFVGSGLAKNCIAFDNTTDDIDSSFTETTNITSSSTALDSDGYHLSSEDTEALDQGTDLSADGTFAFDDDIDKETRSGTWDVGCDEYIAPPNDFVPAPMTVNSEIDNVVFKDGWLLQIGDSIAYGTGGSGGGWGPYLVTALGWTKQRGNLGVPGDSSTDVEDDIEANLITYRPKYAYMHVGTNDPSIEGLSEAETIDAWDGIKGFCDTYDSELIANQLLPKDSEDPDACKKLNGILEDWCFTNNVKMGQVYEGLADPNSPDRLLAAYSADGVHPTNAGYSLMGTTLMPDAAVPTRSIVWGSSSYPTFGFATWRLWLMNGSSSTDTDTGTLTVPNGDSADSPVFSYYPNGRTVSITPTVSSGTQTIYYREASSNFARNAATSWTEYTAPFSSSNRFIQIRVAAEDGDEVNLSDIELDWSEVSNSVLALLITN